MVIHLWEKLVWLIRLAFAEGGLLEELTWVMIVHTSKGKEEYWGIGLMEVSWKVFPAALNLGPKRGV